jgi:hypothetical protein
MRSKESIARIFGMTKEPNIVEQAFDFLSGFPYLNLKECMRAMWVFATVFSGFVILVEALAVLGGRVEVRSEWVKNLVMWVGINPFFAYMFHLWERRDRERKSL